jgi:type 2 lantibiotic biosynthesis protein LanM
MGPDNPVCALRSVITELAGISCWEWLSLAERREVWGGQLTEPAPADRLRYWRSAGRLDDGLFARRLAAEGWDERAFAAAISHRPPSGSPAALPAQAAADWRMLEEIFPGLAGRPPVAPSAATEQLFKQWQHNVPVLTFLEPFLVWADRELAWLPVGRSAVDDLMTDLCGRLASLATRTLVLLMRVDQLRRQPAAMDPVPHALARFVADPALPQILLRRYPALLRLMVRLTRAAVRNAASLAERLHADRRLLTTAGFVPDPAAELVAIRPGLSDPHRGQAHVLGLIFSDGSQLAYKPRPLQLEERFQALLSVLGDRGCDLPFDSATVLARTGYGWMRWVAPQPCDAAGARLFFRRQGQFLALFQALGAVDLHSENVVASGGLPVWVDLECLLHTSLDTGPDPLAEIRAAFRESVAAAGMLPLYGGETADAVEIGGLGGRPGQFYPRPGPTWSQPGTSQMRLSMAPVEMPASNNVPVVDGRRQEVWDYRDELVEGYRAAYDLLIGTADDPEVRRALAELAGCAARLLLRPTEQYTGLLWDAAHPDFLRSMAEAELPFERLWSAGTEAWRANLVQYEVAQLRRGDVPVFVHQPSTGEVRTPDGEPIARAEQTGLAACLDRLSRLSPAHRNREIGAIRAALAAARYTGEPVDTPPPPLASRTPDRAELIDQARAIGARLIDTALGDGALITWSAPYPLAPEAWRYGGIGVDLYAGNTGVALFLAALAVVDPHDDRWRDAAGRAAAYAAEVVLTEPGSLPLGGAMTGLASTVRGLARIRALIGGDRLEVAISAGLQAIAERAAELADTLADGPVDLLDGLAGAVVAVDQLAAPELLELLAGPLLEATERWHDTPGGLCGAAHGAAGIALAHGILAERLERPEHASAVARLLHWENGNRLPAVHNWADLRAAGSLADHEHLVAWCHGAAGIGLTRFALADHGYPAAITDAREAVQGVLTARPRGNDTLCHGTLGNLDLLLQAARRAGRPEWQDEVLRWTAAALDRAGATGHWSLGTPPDFGAPGLMTGISGIGYQLLRIADPRIPSVLAG